MTTQNLYCNVNSARPFLLYEKFNMANSKRAWKLQEFAAHGADVNCIGLGHKSGRVMVTGGEDRKVNLWSVSKPHCIMSLSGHTTNVEAVRFGHAEEMVVAGSQSGALKVWDLEHAKILRTLTGHKAGIKSLDFHPYGEYTASGSMDCNIKLWDIRRKGCIFTYKGHLSCVNCLRFSPDGRWIASAGEDGLIKVWDLTAGKQLAEMKLHKGAVSVVEFHPHELLLASGSADRTVKFWDLETFQLVSSTDGDSSPVRWISFHPDGVCLYSSSRDMLKVYGWEPIRCYDSVSIAWGDVCDMSIANTQLIGASFYKSNVSTFVVDLEKVAPLGESSTSTSNSYSNRHQSGSGPLSSSRKSFITDRPPPQSSPHARESKKADETSEKNDDIEDTSAADIQNPAEYRELFQPNAREALMNAKKMEPFRPPPEDMASPELDSLKQAAPDKSDRTQQNNKPHRVVVERSPPPQKCSPRQDDNGINAEDFLTDKNKQGKRPGGMLSEEEILDAIEKGHSAMLTVMSGRSRNLQIVRAMWTSGNTKTAIDSAISMNDPAVLVDVVNVLNQKTLLWNLDLCTALLPQLKELLSSKYESYVVTAAQAVKLVIRNMGQTIKQNVNAPPSLGVDISREERQRKCNKCYNVLMDIRSMLENRTDAGGKLNNLYREIMLLLNTLE